MGVYARIQKRLLVMSYRVNMTDDLLLTLKPMEEILHTANLFGKRFSFLGSIAVKPVVKESLESMRVGYLDESNRNGTYRA